MKKFLLILALGTALFAQSQVPTTAPTSPTASSSKVKSIFSDAYSNVTVTEWGPNWGASSSAIYDYSVSGNNMKYIDIDASQVFAGINFAPNKFDATSYTHFRMDYYLPGSLLTGQVISIKLSNHDGAGETNALEYTITSPQVNQWVSLNIPLSSFTPINNASRTNMAQVVISAARASLSDTLDIYFDNMYFFDSTTTTTIAPAPTPTRAAADVISVYSDAYTNIGADLNPNWGQSTNNTEIQLSGNNTRSFKTFNYQGMQFSSAQNLSSAGMTNLHIDFLTTQTGTFRLSLISPGPVETAYNLTIPTTGWSSVDIPLTSFSPVDMSNVIQIKFDNNGGATFTDSVLIDNIYFYKPPTTAAILPAPTPTRAAADVISVYSDTYTNIGVDLNPNWGQSTNNTEIQLTGNNTRSFKSFNYQGMQFSSAQNLSGAGMTNLHLDFLTTQTGTFRLSLISPGPVETAYNLTIPTTGWSSVDIPLTSFSPVDMSNVIQIKFDNNGGATFTDSILIDNIYFYKPAAVTGIPPAPTPTRAAADVISVYSDAYTNIGADLNPNWGQSTNNSEIQLSGNNTRSFKTFNYQGMQFNAAQNLSVAGMTHIHLDYYTTQTGTLRFFLISPPNETPYSLTIPTTGWTSIDIPLSAFTGIDLTQVLQFKFDNNGGATFTDSVLFDNIYFYKPAAVTGIPPAPTPTRAAADVISVYSDTYTNIPADLNPNWGQSTNNTEIQLSGNNTRSFKSFNYQGMQFNAAQNLTAAGMTHIHLDYYTTQTGTLRFFLISPPNEAPYSLTIPTTGWTSIDIPLSAFTGIDLTQVLQFKFDNNGGATFTDSVLFDNIYFYKPALVSAIPPAPTPTTPAANVKSIYSDAYTNIAVNEWGPNWGPYSTPIVDSPLSGNASKYINMTAGRAFAGIDFAPTKFDANPYTHFHVDFYMKGPLHAGQVISFKLSNHDGTGETSAIEYQVVSPTVGQWVSVDVPLSSFTVALNNASRNNIAQIIVSAARADLNNLVEIFIDNIYFYNTPVTGGLTPAPVPTKPATDVISIFSDTYTNVAGTDYNPGWGQSTQSTQFPISGNNTMKLKNFNYQGIQFGGAQNLSAAGMTNLHIDFQTPQTGTFRIFLISPGPVETPYTLTIPTSGWSSVDIPLTSFAPVDLSNVIQIKFDNNGGAAFTDSILIDNIYFYKPASTTTTNPILFPITFEDATVNYTFSDFGGSVTTKVANPQANGINTSASVAKMVKGTGAETWAGSYIQVATPINFTGATGIKMKVWSPKAGVTVRMKLENATSTSIFEEIDQTVTNANTWQELSYTFTNLTQSYQKIVVFYDFGTLGANETFYFDDIMLKTTIDTTPVVVVSPVSFPLTFEPSNISFNFTNVGGATTTRVANPYKTGINTSDFVAKTNKRDSASSSAYSSLTLPTAINLTQSGSIKMQVWSPLANIKVKIRLENASDPTKFIEIERILTSPNAWQELEFELPKLGAGDTFNKFSVIFDADNVGTGADFYYDNVMLKLGSSSIVNVNNSSISMYPNPVQNTLNVKSDRAIGSIRIYNINGQEIWSQECKSNTASIDVQHYSAGQYILKTISQDKVSVHKFIKN